jgi:hypothetical protein
MLNAVLYRSIGADMRRRRLVACAAYLASALIPLAFASPAVAQVVLGCGSLANAYGPFDYRNPEARSQNLPIVVRFHFTPNVATLLHGESGTIIGDLDYTLRAFPNFYPALQTVERYALEGGKFPPDRPAECYFKRAVAFRPDDAGARTIYGNYLLSCATLRNAAIRRRLQCGGYVDPSYMDPRVLKAAKGQYEDALRLAPSSPDVNYDAALFFLDIDDLQTAKRLAAVAYQAGYPLMGLKEKLAAAEARRKAQRSAADRSH